jgi:hypothetical protein
MMGENMSSVLVMENALPRVTFDKFVKKFEDSVDICTGRAKKVTIESSN